MPLKKKKNRLDNEIMKRQLVDTLKEARAYIMAGDILVDGQVVYQPSRMVNTENNLELKEKSPYVSRGAYKLKKALLEFQIDVRGLKVVDIGISTGGFSDYLLQKGAERVVGVDVNIQQVDYSLRKNSRLQLIKKNARYLTRDDIKFYPELIVMDVSFISVKKILPALATFKKARIITLIKPQFEVSREKVEKGGVIRNIESSLEVLLELKRDIQNLNFAVTGFTPAGLKGRKGNLEYFFLLKYGKKDSINDRIIIHGIKV
jgi:23S rRNA (cytidine1920-2'-O)/16S rRNA (cytidine1409-2'-O)-methyltransferase